MTDTNDPVFQAIRRDHRSRLAALEQDRERKTELVEQLADVSERIALNMKAMAALETFAIERNWGLA